MGTSSAPIPKTFGRASTLEQKMLEQYFMRNIFGVLTPLAVDPAHPFPHIANQSLNIGLTVETKTDPREAITLGSAPRFVRIKVPPVVPRLIRIGERSERRMISTPPSGMRSSKATAKTPTSWKRLVMLDLLIFPLMIA